MKKPKPTITVGIPAYNEGANLSYLLGDLINQIEKRINLKKIIVYSDGSTDSTIEKLKKIKDSRIKIIEARIRKGQAFAQNQIIKKTNSDILVLVNADIAVKDQLFLERLTKPIQKDGIDLTSARVEELPPASFMEKILYSSMEFKNKAYEAYRNGKNIYTCHGRTRALSKKLYKNLIFKNSIGEDAYSYLYCKYHGYKYSYVKDTQVYYRLPATFSDHEKQSLRFYKSQKLFNKEFGREFVSSNYYLPKSLYFKFFLHTFFKRPELLLYLLIVSFLKLKSSLFKNVHEIWEPAKSSKVLKNNSQRRKIRVCFFGTYDKNYTSNQIVLKGLMENNIPVVEINSEVKLTKLDQKIHMGWAQIIVRILKKYRISVEIFKNLEAIKQSDVIYVGFPGHVDVFLAYFVTKIFGKKLVFNPIVVIYTGFVDDQRFLRSNSLLAKGIKFAEKLAYTLPDLVIADTPEQKKHLMKLFGIPDGKIKTLPLGADSEYYRYTLFKVKEAFNAVYYGLYTPLHGVEHIIECANILKEEKDIKFTLVGQGNTFEENFERAKKLKLSNVEFFHHIPVEKHPAIIEKADVFFGFLQNHPSVERIIPNKVYQGLALGKAVVAADSAVMRSVFTHKQNVYLCKAGDPKDLARAILDLRNNVKLRKTIAENGYKLYMEKFTPKAVGRKLIDFVQEIL